MKKPKDKFAQDRHDALEEIRVTFTERIRQLALQYAQAGMVSSSGMTLPDYVRTEETFRWPAAIVHMAVDLQADKPLSQVFAAVSERYDAKARPKKPAVTGDLDPSPSADGRRSAFDDVIKALNIAERDFDENYKALGRDQLDYWQKRHPIGPEHLKLAHKENQRHFRKAALAELRTLLEDLRDNPPAGPKTAPKPGAKPPAP